MTAEHPIIALRSEPVVVYVSAKNDVGLSQMAWVQLQNELIEEITRGGGHILGRLYSAPQEMWPAFVIGVELAPGIADRMIEVLSGVARAYGPPSLAWAEASKTIRLG